MRLSSEIRLIPLVIHPFAELAHCNEASPFRLRKECHVTTHSPVCCSGSTRRIVESLAYAARISLAPGLAYVNLPLDTSFFADRLLECRPTTRLFISVCLILHLLGLRELYGHGVYYRSRTRQRPAVCRVQPRGQQLEALLLVRRLPEFRIHVLISTCAHGHLTMPTIAGMLACFRTQHPQL